MIGITFWRSQNCYMSYRVLACVLRLESVRTSMFVSLWLFVDMNYIRVCVFYVRVCVPVCALCVCVRVVCVYVWCACGVRTCVCVCVRITECACQFCLRVGV